MASFTEMYSERARVLEAVVVAAREAEEWRVKEYEAAVTIQCWFRGCRVRAYIRYLHQSATIIQTAYRGHLARKLFRQKLKTHLELLRQQYYDSMATKIQKVWRGYFVRRYVHHYYAQKTYFIALRRKNEIVRSRLEEHREVVTASQLARDENLQKLREEDEARRYHYMLSTETKPGVFRHPKRGPLPFEVKMRSVKFSQQLQGHRKSLPEFAKPPVTITRQEVGGRGTTFIDLAASTGDCRLRYSLPQTRVQGPFQAPEQVWRQRVRPLNPTLRVVTPYNSVESARAELKAREESRRVVEKEFLPFSKTVPHYDPLLHTQSPYHRPAYGTKHFREEGEAHNTSQQYFRTVVPPIPLFDRLNSTY